MPRLARLRWLARRLMQLFVAATLVVIIGILAAIALTSLEEVSRAVDRLGAIMDWVRPLVIAAVLVGWPWILGYSLSRGWIDEEECTLLFVSWESLAVLLILIEVTLVRGHPLIGFLGYAIWRTYRDRFPPKPLH